MALILKLLSRLPLKVLYGIAGALYFVIYRVVGFRRILVRDNLQRSFPDRSPAEIETLVRQFYRSYADVLVEMIGSLHIDRAEIADRVTIENQQLLREPLQRGEPVLITVAHHCNIEWLLLAVCEHFDYPFEAIYRPLSNPAMESLMASAYVRFGGTLIDDRSVIKEIMARKTEPRIIAIAPDQSPNRNDDTYWTRFLHQDTGFFQAPDTLAKFTGYPVFFLAMSRTGRGRYRVEVKPLAAPPYPPGGHTVVAAYVAEVERQIQRQPADWLWIHRRWKRKRPLYG